MIGTHGRTGFAKLFLGSVASRVLAVGALSGPHRQGKVARVEAALSYVSGLRLRGAGGSPGASPAGRPGRGGAGSEGLRLRRAVRGRVRRGRRRCGTSWWPAPGRPRASATTTRPTGRGRLSTATAPTTASRLTSGAWTWASSGESGALSRRATRPSSSSSSRRPRAALYWLDLERLLTAPLRDARHRPGAGARPASSRAPHAVKRDEPTLYERRIRELVGHGECLMGILDSYPHPYPLLPPHVCEALEHDAVSWRWRLRGRSPPAGACHGDFHPWNLLFRDGHRLLGARPEPRGMGRAGRRRERARHQLPVLRAPQGGARDGAGAWRSPSSPCSARSSGLSRGVGDQELSR